MSICSFTSSCIFRAKQKQPNKQQPVNTNIQTTRSCGLWAKTGFRTRVSSTVSLTLLRRMRLVQSRSDEDSTAARLVTPTCNVQNVVNVAGACCSFLKVWTSCSGRNEETSGIFKSRKCVNKERIVVRKSVSLGEWENSYHPWFPLERKLFRQ